MDDLWNISKSQSLNTRFFTTEMASYQTGLKKSNQQCDKLYRKAYMVKFWWANILSPTRFEYLEWVKTSLNCPKARTMGALLPMTSAICGPEMRVNAMNWWSHLASKRALFWATNTNWSPGSIIFFIALCCKWRKLCLRLSSVDCAASLKRRRVVLVAQKRALLGARWDHKYSVTWVHGPVLTVNNTRTGKRRVINRDKVELVDPDLEWSDVRPRPTRTARQPINVPTPAPPATASPTGQIPSEYSRAAHCKDMTYLDFLCSRILLLELWLIHDISTHYNIMIICNYTNK